MRWISVEEARDGMGKGVYASCRGFEERAAHLQQHHHQLQCQTLEATNLQNTIVGNISESIARTLAGI